MNASSPQNQSGGPASLAGSDALPLWATLADLARRNGRRLVVLFGSAARGETARDLDLAIALYERFANWAVTRSAVLAAPARSSDSSGAPSEPAQG